MSVYQGKPVKDSDDKITGYEKLMKVHAPGYINPGYKKFYSDIDTRYPKIVETNPGDADWHIEEDAAKATRETNFSPAEQRAKEDAVIKTWDNLTIEQRKLIMSSDLSDAEKDQIIVDFPEA